MSHMTEVEQAVAARDREWMEALHPGNVDTTFGRSFGTPQAYAEFAREREALDREDNLPLLVVSSRDSGADAGPYHIGTVRPPTELAAHEDARKYVYWQSVLDRYWARWREELDLAENPPDADSQFIDWLCREHGFTEVRGVFQHTVEW